VRPRAVDRRLVERQAGEITAVRSRATVLYFFVLLHGAGEAATARGIPVADHVHQRKGSSHRLRVDKTRVGRDGEQREN